MNIGIAAPCNPSEFIDYYYSRDDVPSFNLDVYKRQGYNG